MKWSEIRKSRKKRENDTPAIHLFFTQEKLDQFLLTTYKPSWSVYINNDKSNPLASHPVRVGRSLGR